MKFRLFMIIGGLLLWSGLSMAQVDRDEYPEEAGDPYPITNEAPSPEAKAFIAQFDDKNVGNLHVYSTLKENFDIDYPYKGEPLGEEFYSLMDGETIQLLAPEGAKAYAIQAIRGDATTYFLMRMPSAYNNHNTNLMLFELNGEYLESKEVLAFAYEKKGVIYQQDSWILDLDGDTLLDIVKKYQQRTVDGEILAETIITKKQLPNGLFVRTDELEVDKQDYRLERLVR